MNRSLVLKLDGADQGAEWLRPLGSIEISGFTWGNELRPLSGSMIGPGKIRIRDLTVFKRPDASSPVLRRASSAGDRFRGGELTVEEYAENGAIVSTTVIELESVQVDIVTPAGVAPNPAMTEAVVLNFRNYRMSRVVPEVVTAIGH